PGIVGPVNIEARSVQDSTKSGVATVYVLDDETQDLVLHTNGRFARSMVDSMPNSWEFAGVTKRLYQDFEDEFDFVLIFRHGIPGICGLGAFVNQTVSGIGLDEIDANATYGSQGRLLGVPFVGVESGANRSTFGFPYRLV